MMLFGNVIPLSLLTPAVITDKFKKRIKFFIAFKNVIPEPTARSAVRGY